MSQDEPKQPELPETPPQSSDTPPPVDPPTETTDSANPPVQTTWQQFQPVLKAQSIKALRKTIQVLESLVETLEAEPKPAKLPSRTPPGEQPLLDAAEPQIAPATGELSPGVSIPGLRAQVIQWWQQLQGWWSVALRQIRRRLPASINQKFSDLGLTGAIAATLLLLWITPVIFSSKPTANKPITAKPQPTEIAKAPPSPAPIAQPTPAQPTPTAQPTSLPELRAPEAPKPVDIKPTPKAAPPPKLNLTPEQRLIAAIQNQVADISNQYSERLIQSVQANFKSSRLTVRVSQGWYDLSQTQQNKLADEILTRSRKLDFSRLELNDPENTLLARSPVVGDSMVILKRRQLIEVSG